MIEHLLQFAKSHNKMEIYRYVVNNSYIYKLPLGKMVNYNVNGVGVFIEIEIPNSEKSGLELPFVPMGGVMSAPLEVSAPLELK